MSLSQKFKHKFGRHFRRARDKQGLSRAKLGEMLGISPKTVQSWESGRTFIEDLSLISSINEIMDIDLWNLLAKITSGRRPPSIAESAAIYGNSPLGCMKTPSDTPLKLHTTPTTKPTATEQAVQASARTPVLRPRALQKPISELTQNDITHYTVIPSSWTPRGGVLVAIPMTDTRMMPIIPQGSTVVIDRRPLSAKKASGRIVALSLMEGCVRIRRLIKDADSGKLVGATALGEKRGRVIFDAENGDSILGKVVGVLAKPL